MQFLDSSLEDKNTFNAVYATELVCQSAEILERVDYCDNVRLEKNLSKSMTKSKHYIKKSYVFYDRKNKIMFVRKSEIEDCLQSV